MQKVNAHSLDKALMVLLEDEHNISATIAKAHDETCDYTREKVATLLDAARSRPVYAQCPPQMVSTAPIDSVPLLRLCCTLPDWVMLATMYSVHTSDRVVIGYTVSSAVRWQLALGMTAATVAARGAGTPHQV